MAAAATATAVAVAAACSSNVSASDSDPRISTPPLKPPPRVRRRPLTRGAAPRIPPPRASVPHHGPHHPFPRAHLPGSSSGPSPPRSSAS
ncbi:hypothetical protein CFC21_022838, partial [Triticum aestivum]